MPNNLWYVYILQCADDTLYTGIATDVNTRLATHNAGKGAKYTRGRLPVTLLYCESAETRSTALQREHAIKQLRVADKRALIATQSQNKPSRIARRRANSDTTTAAAGKATRPS